MEAVNVVIGYHQGTKHHFNRYAPSLGYLDWANQPDPFRRFQGAPLFRLPFPEEDTSPPYETIHAPGAGEPRPVTVDSVAEFFENALALSAGKEYGGERWWLRCNPSSGNLHPTEGYLVAGPVPGLHDRPAVYHYAPLEHGLERRTEFDPAVWEELVGAFPPGTFLAGMSSVHWREAWKYGERAYRYCQHDAGHALAALALSAAVQGRRCVHLEALSDDDAAALLGLDRSEDFDGAEREHPDLVVAVGPAAAEGEWPRDLPRRAVEAVARGPWRGRANVLSTEHVDWPMIAAVENAAAKPVTPAEPFRPAPPVPVRTDGGPSARRIIQQRRSAVALDGRTSLDRDVFYALLRRLVPRPGAAPWDVLAPPPAIHLAFFVHRVLGMLPGLYLLVRDPAQEAALRGALNHSFLWEPARHCPPDLPLFVLEYGDFREAAALVSCGQDIAGDGAFCVAMIAEFEERLRSGGSWYYRRLFWEAGMVGQVLYLEAEAAGLRGTGIGCYFDDPTHEILGLRDLQYQSLYHFTVGGPLEDRRLMTRPPYSLERRRTMGPAD